MAKIEPFKAVFYNKEKIKDLSSVVCPPYDVISDQEKNKLYKRDPNNYIRLVLSNPKGKKDKYLVAREIFSAWQREKLLVNDGQPCIYFYFHSYKVDGKFKNRIGFVSLLKLDDKKSNIYPHEHTHSKPKEDRLNLIRSVNANLEPIFALYLDKKKTVEKIYDKYFKKEKPFISAKDKDNTLHKIWRVDNPGQIRKIKRLLDGKAIFIADGHHRFEVSRLYRLEQRRRYKDTTKLAPYDYIMTYFTNANSSDLTIFAVHRIIKDMDKALILEMKSRLNDYFDIYKVESKSKLLEYLQRNKLRHSFGLYEKNKFYSLILKKQVKLDKIIVDNNVKEYKSLDVAILNTLVIRNILKLDLLDVNHLVYKHDLQEAIDIVDKEEVDCAFLLNPLRIEQLVRVASKWIRLPPKSTYFYPKLLSGVLINKLE